MAVLSPNMTNNLCGTVLRVFYNGSSSPRLILILVILIILVILCQKRTSKKINEDLLALCSGNRFRKSR